jgi:hypothetical protein
MKQTTLPRTPPNPEAGTAARVQLKAERAQRLSRLRTTLHFACSATGKKLDYDVPSDADTLKSLWSRQLMLSCPHCGEVHGFSFRTAYLRAVIDEHARTSSVFTGMSLGASEG